MCKRTGRKGVHFTGEEIQTASKHTAWAQHRWSPCKRQSITSRSPHSHLNRGDKKSDSSRDRGPNAHLLSRGLPTPLADRQRGGWLCWLGGRILPAHTKIGCRYLQQLYRRHPRTRNNSDALQAAHHGARNARQQLGGENHRHQPPAWLSQASR